MPATSKAALLAVTSKELAKLRRLVAPLTRAQALQRDVDGLTIKDIIAHRAHWIELYLGWYADGLAGREVHFPAKGYKWSELKRYNADLRVAQKGLDWVDAIALFDDKADALERLIKGLDNDELYGMPMKGGKNTWTAGRWAEAAGASHYRSASKYIRTRLREMG